MAVTDPGRWNIIYRTFFTQIQCSSEQTKKKNQKKQTNKQNNECTEINKTDGTSLYSESVYFQSSM